MQTQGQAGVGGQLGGQLTQLFELLQDLLAEQQTLFGLFFAFLDFGVFWQVSILACFPFCPPLQQLSIGTPPIRLEKAKKPINKNLTIK